ncbi:CG2 [Cryptosporidium hominis TU502]|uniref:CG2 n=1 Tax=Cryptosporidium hominis (strain TU502) TaxID=353151 RepID=UPI000045345A|nr:CG2 [Cryptosporidium hominis TU502]
MRLTNEETEEFQKSFAPVSYGHLSRQLVEHSYSEFLDLLGRCTSDPNVQEEAKTCLWEYSAEVREVFLRILAIGSLSRIVDDINRAIQLRETLVSMRFKQRKLAFDFYPALTMVGTPSPNITSAMDMILLKDFSQMPNLLEELVTQHGKPVIVPKMSEIQEKLIEKQLRDEFFIMYANSGICKSRMIHFDIVKGRIMLEKKSRFSLILISDLKEWQVIDAKIIIPEILSLYTVTKEQNSSFKEILQAQIYYMFNCREDQSVEPVQDIVKALEKDSIENGLDNINSEKEEIKKFEKVKDFKKDIDVLGELYKISNIITGEIILEMFLEQSILSIKERGIAGIYHSERNEYKYKNDTYKYIDIYLYKNADITNLTNFDNEGNFDFARYSLVGTGLNNSNIGQTTVYKSMLHNRNGTNIILRFLMIPNGDIKCILWPFSLLFIHKNELSDDVNSVLDIISENESWKYLCNWEKTNHNNILDLSKVLNHVSNVFRCYLLELYSLKLEKYLDKNATIERNKYSITLRLLDYSEYILSIDIFTGSLVIRDSNFGNNSIWKNYPTYYENMQKALQSKTDSFFQLLPYLLKLTKFQIIRNEFSLNYGWRPICNVPTPIQESILKERKLKIAEFPELEEDKRNEDENGAKINKFESSQSNLMKNGSSVIINTVIDNILTMTNILAKPERATYTHISRDRNEFDYFFYPKKFPDNSRVIYIKLDTESCEVQVFKIFLTKNCRYTEDIDNKLSKNNEIYRILGKHNFENNKRNDYYKGKVILAEFDINLTCATMDQHLTYSGAKDTLGGKSSELHAPDLQVKNHLHAENESDKGYVLKYVGLDEIEIRRSVGEVFDFYSGNFETKHSEILELLELLKESASDHYFPFKLYSRLDRSGQLELNRSIFCMGIKEYSLFFQPYKDFERDQFLLGLNREGTNLSEKRIQFKIQVCKIGAGKFPILNRSKDYSGVQSQESFFYRLILETNQDKGFLTFFNNGEISIPLICSLNGENEALLFDKNYKMEFSVCDEECNFNPNISKEWKLVNTISLVISNNALIQEGFVSTFIDYWYRILRFLHKSLETIYMAYYSKPNYLRKAGNEMVSRRDFLIKKILPWEIELEIIPWSLLFGDSLSNKLFQKLNYKGSLIKIQLLGSSVEHGQVNQVDSESLSNINNESCQGFENIDFIQGRVRGEEVESSDFTSGDHLSDVNVESTSNSNSYISGGFIDSHHLLEKREFIIVDIVDNLLTKNHIEIYQNYLRDALIIDDFGDKSKNILCKAFWKILRSYEISASISLIESKTNPDIQDILQKDIHGLYDSLNTLSLKRIDEIDKFLLSFGLRKVGMHIIFLFEIDPKVHYKIKISLFDVQNIQVGGSTTQQSIEVINHTKRLLFEFIRGGFLSDY